MSQIRFIRFRGLEDTSVRPRRVGDASALGRVLREFCIAVTKPRVSAPRLSYILTHACSWVAGCQPVLGSRPSGMVLPLYVVVPVPLMSGSPHRIGLRFERFCQRLLAAEESLSSERGTTRHSCGLSFIPNLTALGDCSISLV